MSDGPTSVALLLTTPGWRGSGTSFIKIAGGLAARGHDVILVAGEAGVAERLAPAGVPVHLVETHDTGRREVAAVRRLLAEHRTRVVIADAPRDVRIARYASLLTRRAVVWRFNLGHRNVPPDPLQRFLFGGLAAVVQQSAFGSARLLEGMPWLRPRRMVTIPNGYDTALLAPDREAGQRWRAANGLPLEQVVVLTAGALVPGKETALVAEALAGIPAHWVVAGAGPDRERLGEVAAARGVATTLVGELPPAELHDAMRAADLVVQPSSVELFPNVIAEAMALGRAVIGPDRGPAPEVIGEAGLTFRSGDQVALRSAITALLADAERRERLGIAARERIAAVFPLAAMVSGYDALVRWAA